MMPEKEINELEVLWGKGVGLREIIITAYQCGKGAGLNEAFHENIPYGGNLIADLNRTVVAAESFSAAQHDDHLERRGDCMGDGRE